MVIAIRRGFSSFREFTSQTSKRVKAFLALMVIVIAGSGIVANAVVEKRLGYSATLPGHTTATWMGQYGFKRPDTSGPTFGFCVTPSLPAVDNAYIYHQALPFMTPEDKRQIAWIATRWGYTPYTTESTTNQNIRAAAAFLAIRTVMKWTDVNTLKNTDLKGLSTTTADSILFSARVMLYDSGLRRSLGTGASATNAYHLTRTYTPSTTPGGLTAVIYKLTTDTGQAVSGVNIDLQGFTAGITLHSSTPTWIRQTGTDGTVAWFFYNNASGTPVTLTAHTVDQLPIMPDTVTVSMSPFYAPNVLNMQWVVAPRPATGAASTFTYNLTTTTTTVATTTTTKPPTTTTTVATTTTTMPTTTTTLPPTTTTLPPTTTTTLPPTTTTTLPVTTTTIGG